MREKYNLIQELQKKNEELKGKKKFSLMGQGDFVGANNVMRGAMNIKHHTQHLAIDNPEFPFFFDGKENITGETSSFYFKADKEYEVIDVIKKYEELLKGKCYIVLYFLHCKEDDSYTILERKEIENLTENYGFEYNNEYLDTLEKGDTIVPNTMVNYPTSYDETGNTSIGVNARILYAVDPDVQDDAIKVSESFAKRMVTNNVTSKSISINENNILLNLYGDKDEYIGLPDIGSKIDNGILCATRTIKETRMFSDLRDVSLRNINTQIDKVYYTDKGSEIIDINIYCNNPDLKMNKVNKQLIQYYNDAKWFYTRVYKTCKSIIKSGSKNIDSEINRWMRLAMNYLDTKATWAFNDNTFSNIMVEILVRKKEQIKVGRKITNRAGGKTVVSKIVPDNEMPYLAEEIYLDEYGVQHAKGKVEIVDVISNSISIVNRTNPIMMTEGSVTFILDRVRKHAATMEDRNEAMDFMFNVIHILSPEFAHDMHELYDSLSDYNKKHFIEDCISLTKDGLIQTNNGLYVRWEAFNEEYKLRDKIIEVYEKYGDILQPYHIFIPKPKWGRDIYVGQDNIGYQYIMMLKQSGEKGFSVRSSGSISDESLPEKNNDNKTGLAAFSSKPIRFGEYESPNFEIITNPEDFALITGLYRSSIDGRRFMYEAILSEDGDYDIPDNFTSRTSEVLQVYLKSLGIRMKTIYDDKNFIGEPEHLNQEIGYQIGSYVIFCTAEEMFYLDKLHKIYKDYMKENPNGIYDLDEVWDYIVERIPFKKKHLTDRIIQLFKDNLEAFSQA